MVKRVEGSSLNFVNETKQINMQTPQSPLRYQDVLVSRKTSIFDRLKKGFLRIGKFFISLFFCFKKAPSVAPVTVKLRPEAVHSLERHVDAYVGERWNGAYISTLKKKYHGLENVNNLNQLLESQNYKEALHYLWTEKSAKKRIVWLEKQVNKGHPIFMMELGIEYFLQSPTIQVYADKALPWIMAGLKRAEIDASCTSYEQSSLHRLSFNYLVKIQALLVKSESEEKIKNYLVANLKRIKEIINVKMGQVLNQKKMPSPQWIFACSVDCSKDLKNQIPSNQWPEKRKLKAQEILKEKIDFQKIVPISIQSKYLYNFLNA
ncbi:MAG: hypothetical protein K1000chlam2_00332 [Chlamydiae bacterium]|nr:hypothetical protein [Chlamydiota bacterium]